MGERLDDGALSPTTKVRGNLFVGIDNANEDIVGDDGERLPCVLPWDRVLIAVETDGRRLVGAHRQHDVGVRRRLLQGQESRFLLGEALAHAAPGMPGMRSPMNHAVNELRQVSIPLAHVLRAG